MPGRALFTFAMRGIILALELTLVGKLTHPVFILLPWNFLEFTDNN